MEPDSSTSESNNEPVRFDDFSLSAPLQKAIQELGFEHCTPIQGQSIGPILEGKDLAGLAQTGTGKTAAYLIPLIERILRAQAQRTASEAQGEGAEEEKTAPHFTDWHPRNFILVLVPTRELAEQVGDNFKSLAKYTDLRFVSIYGGVGYESQKKGLADGVEFVFATPGRLIDLYKEHLVDLKQVRAIVFDEADRMFDMGFKDDMKYLLQRMSGDRQFLMFSATLNLDVLNVAYQYGAQPVEVSLSRDEARAENVKDYIFHVGGQEKPAHLLSLLKKEKPRQAIVFSNYKNDVGRIATFLQQNGWDSLGISSLLSQAQRQRVMEKFKSPDSSYVLVATDVAARGLDIKGVDLVINFDLPDDAENYVHRIGRTGRASAQGRAMSLVSDRDVEALSRVDEYLGQKIEVGWLEDDELVTDFSPFPRRTFDSRPPVGGRREGPPQRRRSPQGDGAPRRTRREPPEGRRADAASEDGRQQRRPRRERPPRRAPQQGERAEAQQNRAEANSGGEMHRDRRLGRHKGQRRAAAGAEAVSAAPQTEQGSRQQPQRKKKTSQKRRPQQHSRNRGNGRYVSPRKAASAPKGKEGLVGKVSKVFKKLFSGKEESPSSRK